MVNNASQVYNLNGGKLGTGIDATCTAVKASGSEVVRCWGSNESNLLGLWESAKASDPTVPSPVLLGSGTAITGAKWLSGKAGLFCAGNDSNATWCWGRADGKPTGDAAQGLYPSGTKIQTFTPTRTYVSRNIACHAYSSGARCQGDNLSGRVLGKSGSSPNFVPIGGITAPPTALEVAVGHSCAILNTGQVACWGRDTHGQLGQATIGSAKEAAPVSMVTNAKAIAVSDRGSCAIAGSGFVWCWGDNSFYQCGKSSGSAFAQPQLIAMPAGTSANSIAMTQRTACAVVDQGGAVYCWGTNGGASGNYLGAKSSVTYSTQPLKVVGVTGAIAIAGTDSEAINNGAGSSFCAVLATGEVKCWGNSTSAVLGNASLGSVLVADQPYTVQGLSDAVEIRGGDRSFCARRSNGEIWCWGQRDFGQTGEGVSNMIYVKALP